MGANRKQDASIEVVAGAGGAKGPGLIGAFRALEERNVAIGKITGVSIGSLMAAFYANGYKSEELEKLFLEDDLPNIIAKKLNSFRSWLTGLPLIGLGVINMRPAFEELVKEYGLKPRPNLRIVAYNVVTREPVVFEGTQYDLAAALTASCAIPGIMRPVLYTPKTSAKQRFVTKQAAESMSKSGILVDGGVHHFAPGEFCDGKAIVLKLGTVTRFPREFLLPVEGLFHGLEMAFGGFLGLLQKDHPDDIVVEVGPKDVAGLAFSVSPRKCKEMIENGYKATVKAIDRAIKLGQVPTLQVA
jgi:hypothetical protein